MKKILSLLATLFLLNGCVEAVALLGPASTIMSGGNVAQSSLTSAINYGVKKQTGKSPSEHALNYVKKNNPNSKKERCINFIQATNSVACSAVKQDLRETKKKLLEVSKIKNLASKSTIYNKR